MKRTYTKSAEMIGIAGIPGGHVKGTAYPTVDGRIARHEFPDQLTPTESAIAVLVSEGKTNTEIGASLFLSPGTVKNYLSVALAKLHLSNRAALAVYAVTNDLRGDVVREYNAPDVQYDPDCYKDLAFLAYA